MNKHFLLIVLAALLNGAMLLPAAEPLRLSLWPDSAPLGNGQSEEVKVAVTIHLPTPEKATGVALVICPGGGYGGLVTEGEGHGIARWLNAHGIAGVVLEYRLPRGNYHRPLLDAQRALRLVRARAGEWKMDPKRLGIIGFSAGGHLVSTVGTHFDEGDKTAADPVQHQSCRPDFLVLVYPVISLGELGHGGTRQNFLGSNPAPELVTLFSNEKQVTDRTPPTFLTHAKTDTVVPVENSRMFYRALQEHHVPSELLEFPEGNHGYNGYKGKEWDGWQARCLKWLEEQKILPAKP